MYKFKNKPELANSDARNKIINNTPLVDSVVSKNLDTIVNSKVIEIGGGLGEVSEYLSVMGNNVKLVEETRRFFVYRRNLFPDSKVVEMNVNPFAITTKLQHYDYAIIHSEDHLELAKSLATNVFNVEKNSFYGQEPINSSEGLSDNPEIEVTPETVEEVEARNTRIDLSVDEVVEPDQDELPQLSDNKPVSDLEQ